MVPAWDFSIRSQAHLPPAPAFSIRSQAHSLRNAGEQFLCGCYSLFFSLFSLRFSLSFAGSLIKKRRGAVFMWLLFVILFTFHFSLFTFLFSLFSLLWFARSTRSGHGVHGNMPVGICFPRNSLISSGLLKINVVCLMKYRPERISVAWVI